MCPCVCACVTESLFVTRGVDIHVCAFVCVCVHVAHICQELNYTGPPEFFTMFCCSFHGLPTEAEVLAGSQGVRVVELRDAFRNQQGWDASPGLLFELLTEALRA